MPNANNNPSAAKKHRKVYPAQVKGQRMVRFQEENEMQKEAEKGRKKFQENPRIREKWPNKIEFLLAVIGFAVDLGNIWRFPYICYRNGGGAFLIPYIMMFIFGGLPLFYLELALGQYHRSGCISIWRKVCPLFKGVGYSICLVSLCTTLFYNTIIGWAVYYFFSSFRLEVPWIGCTHDWNTDNCYDPMSSSNSNSSNYTANRSLAAEEYFLRNVLEVHKSKGFESMGTVRWQLVLCILFVYTIVYFALFKGPRSTGKGAFIQHGTSLETSPELEPESLQLAK